MSNEALDVEAPEAPNGVIDPAEAKALVTADEDPQETPPPGVLVVKQKDEQGNIAVDAVPVGGLEPTEVLTLLEMGYAAFRAKVGLSPR